MSRSYRSPRTRTRVVPHTRKKKLAKVRLEEALEDLDECDNCVFVTTGTRCPKCNQISGPNYALEAIRTEERLYGTRYGSGRWNEGLGEKTYGKQDYQRRLDAAGLRIREPGDDRDARAAKARAAAENRKQIHHEVSETIRHFDI